MGRVFIRPWLLKYDDLATRAAYKKIRAGGPEACGCQHCNNFALARDRIYPQEVENFLNMVGIDFKKESEVIHLGRTGPSLHLYSGSFYFIGTAEFTPDINCDSTAFVAVNKDFSWQFKNSQEPVNGAFGMQCLVEMEFMAKVPWVIASCAPERKTSCAKENHAVPHVKSSSDTGGMRKLNCNRLNSCVSAGTVYCHDHCLMYRPVVKNNEPRIPIQTINSGIGAGRLAAMKKVEQRR
jgi:hypothetical protein